MRFGTAILIGTVAIALAACHHSSNSASSATSTTGGNIIAGAAANVATISVNAGPGPTASINTPYVSVSICAPGSTTNCQTIDHIAVDTGASGLRIVAAALSPTLAAALQLTVDGNNNAIVECTPYADGYAWGPIVNVDMTISGEKADFLPIQVFGTSLFPAPPAGAPCEGAGPQLDTVASFGANGTLGVSIFAQDCGSGCALTLSVPANPGFYFACSSSTACTVTTVPLTSASGPEQVQNPVTLFALDNNGVIIEMPTVDAAGQTSASGALVFGIDTLTNNTFGSTAIVLTVEPVHGYVSTDFNNLPYPKSFFDTGSSGVYFDVPTTFTTLPLCTDGARSTLYCPTSTASLSANAESSTNVPLSIPFSVASADSLLSGGGSLVAFGNLAGSISDPDSFDWGMPFFYGRNVYFALEGRLTSVAAGPYVAF
jgi:Protein of unknown function (DUF3443)